MKDTHNISDYDTDRFHLTDRQAHCLGVMNEFAIGKYLGIDMMHTKPDVWVPFHVKEHFSLYKNQADILTNIECRRVNNPSNPIAIRQKDLNLNALVVQGYIDFSLINGEFQVGNQVELLGWSDVSADWSEAQTPSWSKTGTSRVVYDKRPMSDFPMPMVGAA
ncbi:hypothetical protein [Rhodococcus opacus]|uniref:hypothetical protein n=1 Tax=Rhodococcus opacus TaxID=37919 RepID=UPI001009BE1F|nr:hypothetical protein [Rhodococcus opacus]